MQIGLASFAQLNAGICRKGNQEGDSAAAALPSSPHLGNWLEWELRWPQTYVVVPGGLWRMCGWCNFAREERLGIRGCRKRSRSVPQRFRSASGVPESYQDFRPRRSIVHTLRRSWRRFPCVEHQRFSPFSPPLTLGFWRHRRCEGARTG